MPSKQTVFIVATYLAVSVLCCISGGVWYFIESSHEDDFAQSLCNVTDCEKVKAGDEGRFEAVWTVSFVSADGHTVAATVRVGYAPGLLDQHQAGHQYKCW